MRDRERFLPFHPRRHVRALQKIEDLNDLYFPSPREIGPIRMGYAEIRTLFKSHCSGGRRGRAGATEEIFGVPNRTDLLLSEAREMWGSFISHFRAEVEHRMGSFGVSRYGYSIQVVDVRCRLDQRTKHLNLYALVELLDGQLNPMLLGGQSVESFYTAPVAYILSCCEDVKSRRARPILTGRAMREAVLSLQDTVHEGGLSALRRPIRSSFIFNTLCDAIAKKEDGVSQVAGHLIASMEERQELLGNCLAHEEIAHSIRSIYQSARAPGFAAYEVTAVINRRSRHFNVIMRRRYDLGTIVTEVR